MDSALKKIRGERRAWVFEGGSRGHCASVYIRQPAHDGSSNIPRLDPSLSSQRPIPTLKFFSNLLIKLFRVFQLGPYQSSSITHTSKLDKSSFIMQGLKTHFFLSLLPLILPIATSFVPVHCELSLKSLNQVTIEVDVNSVYQGPGTYYISNYATALRINRNDDGVINLQ